MTVDAAILAAVVAFLLPLRLLSLALRLAISGRGSSAEGLRRSRAALALTAVLLAVIFALPRDHARECAAPAGFADGGREELQAEVEQLKLQLSRLESLWDNSKALDDKGDVLEEKDDRVIRALGLDIQSLIDVQVRGELREEVEKLKLQLTGLESLRDNLKVLDEKGDALEEKDGVKESLCSSYDDRIKAMENEIQILKNESRKMNSGIYNVQSLAKDTTEKVEALRSDIKKVQAITDEWGMINSNINRMRSFAKDAEKRVEGMYSDLKKGFKRTKRKMPFWTD